MSTTRPKLAAAERTQTGKDVARLRRAGQLPAVVFGHGLASRSLSVDAHEFEKLRRHLGSNALVDLVVDGARPMPVLVHGVQRHRIDQHVLHVDLYAVKMSEEMTVDVPIVGQGDSPAVSMHGGTLLHVTEHVKMKALPDHLPQVLHFDLGRLQTFDDVVHVRDLEIPKDATLLTDGDEIIAKVAAPRVEEEPVAAETTEGAEGAATEGEATAPAAEGAAE